MITTIIIILVAFWILGLLGHIAGGLIHILLIAAIILFVVRLLQGRKAL